MAAISRMNRRDLTTGLIAGLAAPAVLISDRAQAQDPFVATDLDRVNRSTVPVMIDEQGPFRFALDTAANGSVIADDLIEQLRLTPGEDLDMHTVLGLERVQTVRARSLISGALARQDARLVVGDRRGMIGLDGLLGLDLLANQRLVMNFRSRGGAGITRSRINNDSFLGAVRPRVSFQPPLQGGANRLMLVNVTVRGHRTRTIIDTGAQVTLINPVLARVAGARPLVVRSAETGHQVHSPTGRSMQASPMVITAMNLDGAVFDRLGVLMGDFHIFRHLGLDTQPAMLMGIDILSAFSRLVIDLKRGEMIMDL